MIGPGIPGTAFDAFTEGFPDGLVGTIGVRLITPDGTVVVARTTANIIELVPIDATARYRYAGTYPTDPGTYLLVWDDGSDELSDSEVVLVAYTPQSVLNPPSSDTGPQPGPCTEWVTAEDVAECCGADSSDATAYETFATTAAMVLWELSGRVFSGECFQTVRPCRQQCGCWAWGDGGDLGGALAFYWAPWAGWWGNECGDRCGCGRLSRVKLPGFPVRAITEVLIDGEVVPDDEYRLDGYRWLTRMADPGPPVRARYWPSCQNLALDADQPGTFEVTYIFGQDPPQAGVDAAAQLACQLARACGAADGECVLPAGVTRVTRAGVQYERGVLASFLEQGKTGLVSVDAFLAAYNRGNRGRRPGVWSPDVQQYAKRLGS
jgi:hypothetical protein